MNFFERLKIGWAAFLAKDTFTDLPKDGRVSVETLPGKLSAHLLHYGAISPVIDFEMLAALKNLYLFNPDVSQYVSNIVNLGNTGHKLTIAAKSDSTVEAAIGRLNESAARLYPHGAGVDGLINQYLTQIAWSGAVSSEDVVNLAARRVEKVVIVPVEQIRFRYEDDAFRPFQQAATFALDRSAPLQGLIRLNENTYQYLALTTVENSPYAKPPATAAVESILEVQKPILENVKYIAKKLGILGLITALVTKPPRLGNESEAEYNRRATDYLARIRAALDGNFNKGLLVAYRDFKFDHTNVNASASGTYDINRMSEEQVMSGLAMQPAFFGRTDSTTETYADVVYNLLLAQVANMVRLAKRRHETTLRLDLRLAGIEVESVALVFNKAHSRDPLKEAQAEQVRQTIILEKAKNGIISPDDAARELGYEAAFDAALLEGGATASLAQMFADDNRRHAKTLSLNFNRQTGKYEYLPERLSISDFGFRISENARRENVIPFEKKTAYKALKN